MHCRKETDFFSSRKWEVRGARLCDRGGPSPHLNWTANVNYTRNEVSMNADYFSSPAIDQISSQLKGRRDRERGESDEEEEEQEEEKERQRQRYRERKHSRTFLCIVT